MVILDRIGKYYTRRILQKTTTTHKFWVHRLFSGLVRRRSLNW